MHPAESGRLSVTDETGVTFDMLRTGHGDMETALGAIPKLIAALNDEMWDVRYAAEDSLCALGRTSIGPLRAAFVKAPPRARPHILEALAKLGDKRALLWAKSEYKNDDTLVRAALEKQLTEELAAATRKH